MRILGVRFSFSILVFLHCFGLTLCSAFIVFTSTIDNTYSRNSYVRRYYNMLLHKLLLFAMLSSFLYM